MKHWLLYTALVLSLAACNKDDDDDDDNNNTPQESAQERGEDFPMDVIGVANTTITVEQLPEPDTNASVTNFPQVLMNRPANTRFQAPAGFAVNLFENQIPGVRTLAVAPNGDVFAAITNENTIKVLRDTDGNGHVDTTFTWASGGMVSRPYGMAFYNGQFYVAMTGEIVRYSYTRGQTQASGNPTSLLAIPGGGQHPYRPLVLDTVAQKMYVGIGSSVNVGIEDDAPKRATIQMANLDGTSPMGVAAGIRNPQGIAIHPTSRQLWSVVNERDGIGDSLVPDYMAMIPPNSFWGWPWVYFTPDNRDPRIPSTDPRIPTVQRPQVLFEAHSAALGLVFYNGTQFPAEYRDDAYVVMRGSWNRARGVGYKVVRVKLNAQGMVEGAGYEDFVTGWHMNRGQTGPPQVFGRPVTACMARDGSLLVTDDAGGAIWRIRYKG